MHTPHTQDAKRKGRALRPRVRTVGDLQERAGHRHAQEFCGDDTHARVALCCWPRAHLPPSVRRSPYCRHAVRRQQSFYASSSPAPPPLPPPPPPLPWRTRTLACRSSPCASAPWGGPSAGGAARLTSCLRKCSTPPPLHSNARTFSKGGRWGQAKEAVRPRGRFESARTHNIRSPPTRCGPTRHEPWRVSGMGTRPAPPPALRKSFQAPQQCARCQCEFAPRGRPQARWRRRRRARRPLGIALPPRPSQSTSTPRPPCLKAEVSA